MYLLRIKGDHDFKIVDFNFKIVGFDLPSNGIRIEPLINGFDFKTTGSGSLWFDFDFESLVPVHHP